MGGCTRREVVRVGREQLEAAAFLAIKVLGNWVSDHHAHPVIVHEVGELFAPFEDLLDA